MASNAATNAINPLANWNSPVSEIDDPVVLQMYQDALEDVHTRFLLNLPEEELATADRILFQIEQAWWFYEDWICDREDTTTTGALPRFKHLKPFAVEMFQFSPLLDTQQFHAMWALLSKYKRKISTYGCILLNSDGTKMIMCQDWNSKAWTLPAGKINQGEEGIDAAARETWEETGFDPNGKYGLTQTMENVTWQKPLQEKDGISYKDEIGKHRNFFICLGVPEDFPFDPVARKEVASVQWQSLDKIPKKNFAVLPLLPKIRRWIKQNMNTSSSNNKTRQKTPKQSRDRSNPKQGRTATPKNKRDKDSSNTTPMRSNKTPNRKDKDSKSSRKKQASRSRSRGKGSFIQEDDPLFESGLAAVGGENRWSEEDMFQANEKILGRKIEYDGNPHVFSEQGFQGMDPHNFHIVGGNFLNSDTNQLAPPPPTSRLQHLFHTKRQDAGDGDNNNAGGNGNEDSEFLTPFFSDDGATPWGEVVKEVKEAVASPERKMMVTPDPNNNMSKASSDKAKKNKKQQAPKKEPVSIMMAGDDDEDLVFMTDQEITSRSQKVKLAQMRESANDEKYQQDLLDIQAWVAKLPKAPPTKEFGAFKFNVDSLMDALYQHY